MRSRTAVVSNRIKCDISFEQDWLLLFWLSASHAILNRKVIGNIFTSFIIIIIIRIIPLNSVTKESKERVISSIEILERRGESMKTFQKEAMIRGLFFIKKNKENTVKYI